MNIDEKDTYEEREPNNSFDNYGVSDTSTWENTLGIGEVEEKGNVILGLIGAIICSLVGVALWIGIYQLGYIASLSGIVMTICALWGYKKFGGKLDKTGAVISFIVVLFMVYAANHLCYTIEVYKSLHEEYNITFTDSFKALSSLLAEGEVRRSYMSDLGMGYAFCLLGSIGRIRDVFGKSSDES